VVKMDEKVSVSPEQTNCDWNSIDWISCYSFVHILRQRIYRATKEGNLKLVRSLQRLMLRSYENRCLALE
jgi:RNA-directed DNA polymerase